VRCGILIGLSLDNRHPHANPVAGGLAPCPPIAFLDNELAIRILGQKERQSLGHALEVRKQTISWELDSYERKLESVRILKKRCDIRETSHQGSLSESASLHVPAYNNVQSGNK
jgi:hypothetical protein